MSGMQKNSTSDIDQYLRNWTIVVKILVGSMSFVSTLFFESAIIHILTGGDSSVILDPLYTPLFITILGLYPILLAVKGFDIVKVLFRKVGHATFLKFERYITLSGFCLIFLIMIIITSYNMSLMAVISFIAPIWYVFLDNLSDDGKTRIGIEQVYENLNSYEDRQRWLIFVFKKLEDKLKLGRIDVSHNSLVHHVNILLETGKPQDNLTDILDWTIGDRRNEVKIVNSLVKIIPKIQTKIAEQSRH